jgi:hypothetical protein
MLSWWDQYSEVDWLFRLYYVTLHALTLLLRAGKLHAEVSLPELFMPPIHVEVSLLERSLQCTCSAAITCRS